MEHYREMDVTMPLESSNFFQRHKTALIVMYDNTLAVKDKSAIDFVGRKFDR